MSPPIRNPILDLNGDFQLRDFVRSWKWYRVGELDVYLEPDGRHLNVVCPDSRRKATGWTFTTFLYSGENLVPLDNDVEPRLDEMVEIYDLARKELTDDKV